MANIGPSEIAVFVVLFLVFGVGLQILIIAAGVRLGIPKALRTQRKLPEPQPLIGRDSTN